MTTTNLPAVIRYRTAGAHQHVCHGLLVKRTPAKLYLVLTETPIRITRVPVSEQKYISELPAPSVASVKKRLRKAAKEAGQRLSKATRRYL